MFQMEESNSAVKNMKSLGLYELYGLYKLNDTNYKPLKHVSYNPKYLQYHNRKITPQVESTLENKIPRTVGSETSCHKFIIPEVK